MPTERSGRLLVATCNIAATMNVAEFDVPTEGQPPAVGGVVTVTGTDCATVRKLKETVAVNVLLLTNCVGSTFCCPNVTNDAPQKFWPVTVNVKVCEFTGLAAGFSPVI